jgi:acyl transferase domain-containing protein/acyl carrier protein
MFEAGLAAQEPAYLQDHRVFGEVIVPATAYVEMALSAGALRHLGAGLVLENIIFQAPLLPGKKEHIVQTLVKPNNNTSASFQIFSQAESVDKDAGSIDDEWVLHASGEIHKSISPIPENGLSLEQAQTICREEVPVAEIYQRLERRALNYGETFRGLVAVWRNEGSALALVQLPKIELRSAGEYQLHPALLDACMQTAGAIKDGMDDSDEAPFLPLSIDRILFYGPAGLAKLWCHLRLQPLADIKPSNNGLGQELRTADIMLWDETGRLVAEIVGLHVKKAPRAALFSQVAKQVERLLYEVVWREAATSTESLTASPDDFQGRWLLFGDDDPLSASVARQITATGGESYLVRIGSDYARESRYDWRVNPKDGKSFEKLLSEFEDEGQSYPETLPLRGIIYLWGLNSAASIEVDPKGLLAAQEIACGALLALIQALANSKKISWPTLWLVTRGGQAGLPDRSALSTSQAMLWGLGKVIALEHPQTRCTRINLDPDQGESNASILVQEIRQGLHVRQYETANGNGKKEQYEDQVAWRSGRRYTPRLKQLSAAQKGQTSSAYRPSTTGSYLVTGGLGALGLAVAEWLVSNGTRTVVLVGRSTPDEATQTRLTAMEDVGATVLVRQVDVTDRAALQHVILELNEKGLPLRGVVHAAGVLDDGILLRQNWTRFAGVLAPKVLGAANLHEITRDMELDIFVLYSSVAALLGTPGQGSYTAANAYLDTLAHHRHTMGLPAVSINWGPWSESGMSSRSAVSKQRLQKGFLEPLAPLTALKALGQILSIRSVQAAVLDINWNHLNNYYQSLSQPAPSLLSDLKQDNTRDGSKQVERGQLLVALKDIAPRKRQAYLLSYLQEQAGAVLGLDPAQSLHPQRPLNELGLDSLMAVELRNMLSLLLDQSLPATLLFDYPTMFDLSRYITKEILPELLSNPDNVPADNQPKLRESKQGTPAVDTGVLDDMSNDELAEMLANELAAIRQINPEQNQRGNR